MDDSRRDAATTATALVTGLFLLSISNGRYMVPQAIWFGAPLVLIGLRRLPPRAAIGAGLLGFVAVFIVQANGVINLAPPLSLLVAAGFGAIGFLPYAVDRLAAPRLKGVLASLVFPLTLCGVEFVTGRLSPYGTFGAVAYSQVDNLPLLQLASITGLWGVSFMIAWFASTAAGLSARGGDLRPAKPLIISFAAVAIAVLAVGEARLALAPAVPTVRIAGISPSASDGFHFIDLVGAPCQADQCDAARARLILIQNELLDASRREARAGARAILWSEDAGTVFKADEPALLERARALARQENVTLVIALQVLTPVHPLAENKAVVIAPSGAIAAVYEKTRPVPGDPDLPGDGRIPVVESPFGRLASAICFDLDFPPLIRQVGRARADILLTPASDWREIDPLHAQMAVFRAVENGVSLLRETRRGLSIATDPFGRPIASADFFSARTRTLVASVPTRGVATLYPLIGDIVAWLGLAALLALLMAALLRHRKAGSE